MFDNAMAILEAQDLVWISGVILVCLTTIVQKVSKKYKPWSWLAEQFGRAVNKEMLDKLDAVSKKVEELEATDKKQDEERNKQLALDARRRILSTADEIRKKIRHSEEFFNDALDDISFYRNYCRTHPDFENSKAVISSEVIEETYQQCLLEDDFM